MRKLVLLVVACFSLSAPAADVVGIGDSIMEGGCQTPMTFLSEIEHGTESGDTNMSVMHVVRVLSRYSITTTNQGIGSRMWIQLNLYDKEKIPTGVKWAVAHYGVVDIVTGYTWSDVVTNMNAVKAYLDSRGIKMIVDDIFPKTSGTDGQVATIRAWNLLYHEWALTNGAYYLDSHDSMGQVRSSTGQLDDIRTGYGCSADGTHLNTNGVAVWATNIWMKLHSLMIPNSIGKGSIGKGTF